MAEEMTINVPLTDEQAYLFTKNSRSDTYLMTDKEFTMWIYRKYLDLKYEALNQLYKEHDEGYVAGYDMGYSDALDNIRDSLPHKPSKIDLSKIKR